MNIPPPPEDSRGHATPSPRPERAPLPPPAPGGWATTSAPGAPTTTPEPPRAGGRGGKQVAVVVGAIAVVGLIVGGVMLLDDDEPGRGVEVESGDVPIGSAPGRVAEESLPGGDEPDPVDVPGTGADPTADGAVAVAEAAIDALASGNCAGALRLATPRFVEQ